jgi:hypothetical protein
VVVFLIKISEGVLFDGRKCPSFNVELHCNFIKRFILVFLKKIINFKKFYFHYICFE